MIPGDLLSAFPHRQFHTLPGLLDSWAALPNSYPNTLCAMQGGSLYHFYDGLWYDPAERQIHDLPWERRTRYRLSQPDYGVHSLPKLHSYTYYPIMRYLYCILLHAWHILLLNIPLCNIHIAFCYMNVTFGYPT